MNSGSFWLKSLRINIKPYRIKSPKLKLGDFFNLVSQNRPDHWEKPDIYALGISIIYRIKLRLMTELVWEKR
jgi:hypothetical protein